MSHVGGAVEKPSLLGRPLPITEWKREDWVGRENTSDVIRSLVRNTVKVFFVLRGMKTSFDCPRCGHSFKKPNDLRRHLGRKSLCDAKVSDVDLRDFSESFEAMLIEDKPFKCRWCNASSPTQHSLVRHETSCSKREALECANKVLQTLLPGSSLLTVSDVADMSNLDVLRLLSQVASKPETARQTEVNGDHNAINSNVNSNVNSNNVTNVYLTLDFGSEDLQLTLKELETLLKVHPIKAVTNFVEKTHFSSDSGKNWFISNLKDSRAKVLEKGKWASKEADEVVYEVFDKHRNAIDETCDLARNEDGDLPAGPLGERVRRWEQVSNRDNFEDLCQKSVKKLGYENNPKFKGGATCR